MLLFFFKPHYKQRGGGYWPIVPEVGKGKRKRRKKKEYKIIKLSVRKGEFLALEIKNDEFKKQIEKALKIYTEDEDLMLLLLMMGDL